MRDLWLKELWPKDLRRANRRLLACPYPMR